MVEKTTVFERQNGIGQCQNPSCKSRCYHLTVKWLLYPILFKNEFKAVLGLN